MYEEYLKELEPLPEGFISPMGKDPQGNPIIEPRRNYPVSLRENLERALRGERPVYMPTVMDMLIFSPKIIPDNPVRAWVMDMEAERPGPGAAISGPDMFGVEWQFVPETGGSMVRPGDPKIKDITRWEDYITFPDLDAWDWEHSARANAPLFSPERMTRIWVLNGLNERLISLMDFAEVMVAYIDEDQKPGVHRFFDRLCTFYDDLIGRFRKYYKADVLMFNDDWGTMRGPQFSLDTAREMLVPYVRRIVESCHRRGMYFELHCCGKNDLLVPAMIEAGIDMWIPQEDINDFDLLHRLAGGKFLLGIPVGTTPDMGEEEVLARAKSFMEKYGAAGGVMANPGFPGHPKASEYLYCLSRAAWR